jgi:phosphoribosylformylglycinamidine synthase I
MKAAVVVFPGSNCDIDCQRAFHEVTGIKPDLIWHKETSLDNYDFVILPGGFSFGDYLRTGSIARFSPVMAEVERLAKRGSQIIGICNGFQILTEAGLLPGALLRNKGLHFICKDIYLKVESNQTVFTSEYSKGQVIKLPIAHADGNYQISDDDYQRLIDREGILLRYSDANGNIIEEASPNGAKENIAGIINEAGNVFGLMPHPERLAEDILGGIDGRGIFQSMFNGRSGK